MMFPRVKQGGGRCPQRPLDMQPAADMQQGAWDKRPHHAMSRPQEIFS